MKAISTSLPVGGIEEQAVQDEDEVWRHSYRTRRFSDDQRQAGVNASAFFDTGDLRHEVKFGFGYRQARQDSMQSWPGDLLVGWEAFREAGITRRQDAATRANLYDVYLGDTIQAGNLTVNLGARFDYQQGKNLPSAVPANPVFPELLPAVVYPGDTGYPITWRMVQPRVGATYALADEPHADCARRMPDLPDQLDSGPIIAINAFPDIAELYYVWVDANGNGRVEPREIARSLPTGSAGVDPTNPASSVQINQISSSLEPPMTDEIIVGVERQITSDLSGSLAYTYRSIRNLEFSPLIGTTRASYQYLGNATGTAVDEETGFVLEFDEPYYGLTTCPDPCVGTVLENRPDASQTYSGVELQLLKPFRNGWMARVSFAYNDWQQQIGPGAIVNPNDETPGTNASGGYAGTHERPQRALAVQRQRNGPASPRDRGQCERLRPAGVPDALLRRSLDERPFRLAGPDPDRATHAVPNAQCVRGRSAAFEDLRDRLGGHGDAAVRVLQPARQPHGPGARAVRRYLRRRAGDAVRSQLTVSMRRTSLSVPEPSAGACGSTSSAARYFFLGADLATRFARIVISTVTMWPTAFASALSAHAMP